MTRIRQFFSEPSRLAEILAYQAVTGAQQRQLQQRANELLASWPTQTATQSRTLFTAVVQRIVVGLEHVDIQLLPSRIAAGLQHQLSGQNSKGSAERDEHPIVLSDPGRAAAYRARHQNAGPGTGLTGAGCESRSQSSS